MPVPPSPLAPQRHLFDIPDDVAYFNCAYNGPLLNESRDRLHAGVDSKCHPWERTADDFFDDAEAIRTLAAGLFGGDRDGYAVVPSASYGITTAARAVEPRLGRGDRILALEGTFPSNLLPWLRTARETGSEVVVVPTPGEGTGGWTRAILDRLDGRVRVVAVPNCHWASGAFVDVEAVGAACRSADALFVVDATQSLGALPASVEAMHADFLVAAGYKWLLCPYGFGLLWVSEAWRDARPLEETWIAREGARDFASLVNPSEAYQPGARRFEVGEKCTPTLLPGAIAALEQLGRWGVDAVAATLARTNDSIAGPLEALGLKLPEPDQRCPHMFGALLPEGARSDLVGELARQRVYISQRGRSLRFSPHLHVVERDVERLLDAVRAVLA